MFDPADPGLRRRRILLVSPLAPYPANYGGAQRTAHLLRALEQFADVDLYLSVPPPPEDREILVRDHHMIGWFAGPSALLTRICRRAVSAISLPAAAVIADSRKVAAVARLVSQRRYDIVVLRYSATACELNRLRDRIGHTPIVVDTDDLIDELLQRAVVPSASHRRLRHRVGQLLAWVASRRERSALRRVGGLWYSADVPSATLPDMVPSLSLPNIPWLWQADAAGTLEQAAEPVDFIGVAQFSYRPNFDGFDWFLREIWPVIRWHRPSTTIRLIGLPPPEPHASRWSRISGVELAGQVGSVSAHYHVAKIAIAPIQSGGGTKIKVLEALAFGLPCVVTHHAAYGLGELPLHIADDAPRFAEICIALFDSRTAREARSAEGVASIATRYSFSRFSERVGEMISLITAGPAQAAYRDHIQPKRSR